MNFTIKEKEQQIESRTPDVWKELGLLPAGYRCRARLRGKLRDKKRTAAFEKSWYPDTDSIVIEFERASETMHQENQTGKSPQAVSTVGGERPQPPQGTPGRDLVDQFAALTNERSPDLSQPQLQPPARKPGFTGPPVSAPKLGTSAPDRLSDLVRALDRAESRPGYEFVALKWFRDTALTSEGFAWADLDAERQTTLRTAIDRRLVLTSKHPNPKSPQFPVTAIRLNWLMPEVRAILETTDSASSTFRPVSIRGESLSSTVLRDRR